MPRPQRISARERSLVGETPDEDTQEISIDNEKPIDTTAEAANEVVSGQVSEGELDLSRQVARRLGWVSQDEWKRDPSKWTDAPEFLDRTPAEITSLKERLRRSGQVAEDIAENARREAKAQAQAELREAARSGDEERAVKAAEKVAQNSGPHPQTQAWLARNSWFNADPEAQAVAIAAINRATQAGESIEAQLQAGEAAARRRFPEHFETSRETRSEARLSEHRTPPPAVTGGSRGSVTQSKPKEKGWSDIPSADRNQMTQFVRQGVKAGKTEAQVTGFLASAYWRDKA